MRSSSFADAPRPAALRRQGGNSPCRAPPRPISAACAGADPAGWSEVEALYRSLLGKADGRIALSGLAGFIGALGHCAHCPLRFFAPASGHLCRHECLVLALVAALQHGDEDSAVASARSLAVGRNCERLIAAAGEFAINLKMLGCLLLPIPPDVVAQFLPDDASGPASPTIH